jgi:O-antigen biosynthesis protein
MAGTYISNVVLKPGYSFLPGLAALVHSCKNSHQNPDKFEGQRLKCEARGKFLYLDGKKLYLKSVNVNGPAELYGRVAELGANVVWLDNPDADRVGFFSRLGLKVVARFGLEGCWQDSFAGKKQPQKKWREKISALIDSLKDEPCVVAYDLGALVSKTVLQLQAEKTLCRQIQWAFKLVKKLDETRPVTCTLGSRLAHLILPFLDFYSYQIDNSSLFDFRVELSRLQIASGDKPLVVHSPGAVSITGEDEEQATTISEQIRQAFFAGCTGFVLSTFQDSPSALKNLGLVDLNGKTKLSFAAAKSTFADCPFPSYLSYPKTSVVICAYNGEEWIEECLDGCSRLDYPNYEVILINDGSRDRTLELAEPKAARYGFRIVNQIPPGGLSAARNMAMETATGEIIAFLDQDAFPDEHWLRYLAISFLSTRAAVIGGPNINPLSAGTVADCVDQAPGNTQIVFVEDELADHVPGCNLAVRRSFMKSIGGFDNKYRFGGDDVNFCWKVVKAGEQLCSSPGAMIWHYRRKTVPAYLSQQRSYGRGEAALEKDWPERFNSLGHQVGQSRTQAGGKTAGLAQRSRSSIYQVLDCGNSLFGRWLNVGPTMPEWPMLLALLALLSALGFFYKPYFVFLPLFVCGLAVWLTTALKAGMRAQLRFPSLRSRLVVAYLHLAQPVVRLQGRLEAGMTPWRSRCHDGFVFPRSSVVCFQLEEGWLENTCFKTLERAVKKRRLPATPGYEETDWDWQVEGGILGGVHLSANVDHKNLVLRVTPYAGGICRSLLFIFLVCLALALFCHAWVLAVIFSALNLALVGGYLRHAGEALAAVQPLLSQRKYQDQSLWDRFQPPRHYFDQPGRVTLQGMRPLCLSVPVRADMVNEMKPRRTSPQASHEENRGPYGRKSR